MNRNLQKLAPIAIALILAGCGEGVDIGIVHGTVTQAGKPLEQVMVYFMPDPSKGTAGKHSTAVTDANGHYSLTYVGETKTMGAAVGWHRVTLEDLIPENYRGPQRPPRSRLSETFSNAWESPLNYEVKAGEQEINIELPTK